MLSKKLPGLAVVHIDVGQRLGTVRSILLDPAPRRAVALLVSLTQGWMRKGLLAIDHVYAIGDQAVTVEDAAHIVTADEESELWTRWRERVDLHGMPILTERGEGLGVVEAYDFDLSGRVTEIAIRQGVWKRFKGQTLSIPGASIRSFGRDAVIVRAEFAAEIQALRETANRIVAEEDVTLGPDAYQNVSAASEDGDGSQSQGADPSLPARLWQRVRKLGGPKATEEAPPESELTDPGSNSDVDETPHESQGKRLQLGSQAMSDTEDETP